MNTKSIDEKAVFNTARKITDEGARFSYLELACADEPDAMHRVLDLLRVHEEQQSFLESPAAHLEPTHLLSQLTEQSGDTIGPYKLLQKVGEGGMGVVYMAEQKVPVKRRVALKIIKPGMDTRQVIARFEAERQALAIMDHPNIAKVLDAGQTESGRPFFVMELVKGLPVTQYCDEQHLTSKERLELFAQICQAVQHAHQKGIIHRDIKPSNVLVALFDGQPVPKVIDFGVAKATTQSLTEKTMFTQLGQVVGTLEYMSPEQAQVNQLDVDTRSDIYSLGVLLYELLTGDTPFDRRRLRSAAFDQMLQIIREEEPPKPSTKISSSETLPSVAANRRVDPQRLASEMRGELDWIVMKTLEKDRTRRYANASELANDIRAYLNDEVVMARAPSTAYRLRKYARRHRKLLGASFSLLAALVVAATGIAWGYWNSRELKIHRMEILATGAYIDQKYGVAANLYQSVLSFQQSSLGAGDERTVKTRERLANIYVAQNRYGKAAPLYDENLRILTNSPNVSAERIKGTASDLYDACLKCAASTLRRSDDPVEMRTAEAFAKRAVRLAETDQIADSASPKLILLELEYRRKNMKSCRLHAEELLASGRKRFRYPVFLWLAILEANEGNNDLAKDLFSAADNVYHTPTAAATYQFLRQDAASLIFGEPERPVDDIDAVAEEKLLSRLLKEYEIAPDIWQNRGYRRVRLGEWTGAASDFETATSQVAAPKILYEVSRGWMQLLLGKEKALRATCRNVTKQLREGVIDSNHSRFVAWNLCMIAGEKPDPAWLDLSGNENLLHGIVAYSEADDERACDLLRMYGTGPNGALALLLRARAHNRTNQHSAAKEALRRARQILEDQGPLPRHSQNSNYTGYSNSVVWCASLAVLPLAEEEIEHEYSALGRLLKDLRDP